MQLSSNDLKDDFMTYHNETKNRIGTKYRSHMMDLSQRDWQEWNYDIICKSRQVSIQQND